MHSYIGHSLEEIAEIFDGPRPDLIPEQAEKELEQKNKYSETGEVEDVSRV